MAVQSKERGEPRNPTDAVFSRTPPHSLEAEEALLACCLLDGGVETLTLCHEKKLRAEAFYKQAHQIIFEHMLALQSEGSPIDLIILGDRMSSRLLNSQPGYQDHPDGRRTILDFIGGYPFLSSLTDRIPTALHAPHWLDIVVEKWTLRRLINAATHIVHRAYDNQDDIDHFIDHVEKQVFEISQERVSESARPISEAIELTMQQISRMMSGEKMEGVLSGFKDLDTMTFGLHPGEMIVLAARPSMGKTSLAMNIAEQVALPKEGKAAGVLVYSLEMGADQLAMRLICRRAKVNMHRLRERMINRSDTEELARAGQAIKKSRLWVDDSSNLSILELRAKARRLQSQVQRDGGIGLIVVDYLQLISGTDHRVPREQQISEISRGLKSLAKELRVPVIVLSQLNRDSEKENRQPRLSDLRESGSIEQDADVVLLLAKDRDSEDKSSVPSGIRKVELIIAKQRSGPVGSVPLTFIPDYTSFENYTPEPSHTAHQL